MEVPLRGAMSEMILGDKCKKDRWKPYNGATGELFPCVASILRYVVSSLELLVAEDYMIVYLNGATPRRKMPGIVWLKRCYQMIDRK